MLRLHPKSKQDSYQQSNTLSKSTTEANGPGKFKGTSPLKNLNCSGLFKQNKSIPIFQKLPFSTFTCSILEYFFLYQQHNGVEIEVPRRYH